MKPAPFKYHAPTSVEEAVGLLADYGYDAKILAGGQSLIPTMNFRLSQPSVLIDLNRIPDLGYITPTRDGGLRIGAMARHVAIEQSALVADVTPLISETMPWIAHPQIRNRGTFGGSIAHADPSAELPAVLLTLDGRVQATSQRGRRWIGADDFFVDLFTTALEPDEMLTEVAFGPMPARSGAAMREVSRRHGDFALVGVTVLVELDAGGACKDARMTYFSVGDGPVAAKQAVAALIGQKPTAEIIQAAADLAANADIPTPNADIHATLEYRRHLISVLGRQALTLAFERAAQSARQGGAK